MRSHLLWIPLWLAGCAPKALVARVDALQAELAAVRDELRADEVADQAWADRLTEEVLVRVTAALPAAADDALRTSVRDAVLAELGSQGRFPPAPSGLDEENAMTLYHEAADLSGDEHVPDAIAKLNELLTRYPGTRAAGAARRLLAELEVIGTRPAPLTDVEWLQGEATWDDAPVTIVVFWEPWCPHCQREVPALQETCARWRERGVQVIGLTRMTRGATRHDVAQFLADQRIRFPIGWEGAAGAHSEAFRVSGVPAVGVVKDGVVIWRGHPAKITDDMIAGWLSRPAPP